MSSSNVSSVGSKVLLVVAGVSAMVLVCAMFGFGPQSERVATKAPPQGLEAEIVREYPHDETAWTQGLLVSPEGELFESTGMEKKSTVRRVDLETGRVLQSAKIEDRLFGEGMTLLGDRLYMVTWKTGEGLVFDRKTLSVVQKFRYGGEGWGLCTDGKSLILSDGTSSIRFLDPKTFKVTKRIDVRFQGRPLKELNELEYVNGEIWANVWYQEQLARIAPDTGKVTGWVDISEAVGRSGRTSPDHVPNGIAWDAKNKRLFITGKYWPKLFEVKVDGVGE